MVHNIVRAGKERNGSCFESLLTMMTTAWSWLGRGVGEVQIVVYNPPPIADMRIGRQDLVDLQREEDVSV